jgi:hypothetical protein
MGGGRRLVGYSNEVITARVFAKNLVIQNAETRAQHLNERKKKVQQEKQKLCGAGGSAGAGAPKTESKFANAKQRGGLRIKANTSAGAIALKKKGALHRLQEERELAVMLMETRITARVQALRNKERHRK